MQQNENSERESTLSELAQFGADLMYELFYSFDGLAREGKIPGTIRTKDGMDFLPCEESKVFSECWKCTKDFCWQRLFQLIGKTMDEFQNAPGVEFMSPEEFLEAVKNRTL